MRRHLLNVSLPFTIPQIPEPAMPYQIIAHVKDPSQARALVVAPGDVLHVGNAPEREPVEVAVDGVKVADLAAGDTLEVRFIDSVSTLAQLPGTSFYGRIREKFGHLAV